MLTKFKIVILVEHFEFVQRHDRWIQSLEISINF